jgi:hypothetical protein
MVGRLDCGFYQFNQIKKYQTPREESFRLNTMQIISISLSILGIPNWVENN